MRKKPETEQPETQESPLRLLARDPADVEILSALLQDAIIPGADMLFDRESQRFIFIANRFCWERPPIKGVTGEGGDPVFERSLCGVRIEGVQRILQTGMPSKRVMALFNLLAVTCEVQDDGTTKINLVFSGDAALRLIVEKINLVAEDVEVARPTLNQPQH